MTEIIEIKTDRLQLRQWRKSDFELFFQLNSNTSVMKFFPNVLTRDQSDGFATKIQNTISINGWGFWAVEILGTCEFIGFVGLNKPDYELPFSPVIEIGWRLSNQYWGFGYATEAAQVALSIGFKRLKFTEIVAFTSVLNLASIKVMQRINMQNTNTIFAHPKIPVNHQLQKHCLYKITQDYWLNIK